MVLHKITWLHKLVYTIMEQPATFSDLFVLLFVSGYLIVMEQEKDSIKLLLARHLQELMALTELYSSEAVRLYHAV